ncbi:BREX-3 system phosphatase PglZ [Klebsiella grimontii]|uniref:BREX-3 system phosphatase PglZ n=2 Tax=Gammaproteobacteria TaxID=1236 RepID=A0AAD3UJ08_KLEOX|nr:BREX-3 system phosphatase PglZ [Klebsiella grimontii]HAU4356908.1 BREX-3 system phosphatase PglZ [Klebsiella oxytoca]HAU4361935.1 BREX-3 system phosphatase PglZ [Klebsiella oxytoca]HAU4378711.1 BREX-3 system phosphatase PglZ [Klebsiella oxytoca]HAU4384670.1 BREX-3 system phosphatase PglZ [Klebsiella oxytoca]
MNMTWQDDVIHKINLDGDFVYIINDPDGLLYEPVIATSLQEKNAFIFDDDDPLALRLAYETWHSGGNKISFLIRMTIERDIFIPHDIQHESKEIDFHLSEFFQDIDSDILRLLPATLYQSVMDALKLFAPGRLSQQSSLDFLLRNIYRIAPEIIQSSTDLVRLLIRKHYIGIEMPMQIEMRLIHLLSLVPSFGLWNINQLISNKAYFFDFLQKQWEIYLQDEEKSPVYFSSRPNTQLIVPFADGDVRVFIDNLFAEGIIKPVAIKNLPPEHWASFAVLKEPKITEKERILHLLNNAKKTFNQYSEKSANADFWLEQSRSLGIMNALFYQNKNLPAVEVLFDDIKNINTDADELFQHWLLINYAKIQTIPTVRYPSMLHKVPDWISRRIDSGNKICLLVLDGMGARQWPLLRKQLQICENISLEEHSCFAWVPTITSISRQTLFSGKRPFLFGESLLTTNKEEQLWLNYWIDKGLNKREIKYAKKIENYSVDEWQSLVGSQPVKIAGLVINFIDEQMHGMKMGMAGLNVLVDSWLAEWKFKDKISDLLENGFEVIITSDHGNQEAIGMGYINEGVKAETRGERVRIYNNPSLRDSSTANYQDSVIVWPGPEMGLPKGTYPLLACSDKAFKSKGDVVVGHGGISLHEAIVPFIIVNKK